MPEKQSQTPTSSFKAKETDGIIGNFTWSLKNLEDKKRAFLDDKFFSHLLQKFKINEKLEFESYLSKDTLFDHGTFCKDDMEVEGSNKQNITVYRDEQDGTNLFFVEFCGRQLLFVDFQFSVQCWLKIPENLAMETPDGLIGDFIKKIDDLAESHEVKNTFTTMLEQHLLQSQEFKDVCFRNCKTQYDEIMINSKRKFTLDAKEFKYRNLTFREI
eukprot:GHVP01068431.1.p1 GENE.GHVP01068431.1~~GHVP01068431.1.p1  ORF type:complete len:215 (+),score=41.74 GHVP01068431.1:511-1155(+)